LGRFAPSVTPKPALRSSNAGVSMSQITQMATRNTQTVAHLLPHHSQACILLNRLGSLLYHIDILCSPWSRPPPRAPPRGAGKPPRKGRRGRSGPRPPAGQPANSSVRSMPPLGQDAPWAWTAQLCATLLAGGLGVALYWSSTLCGFCLDGRHRRASTGGTPRSQVAHTGG
jgi:hypothetical protein